MLTTRRTVLSSLGAAAMGAVMMPKASFSASDRLEIVATTGMIADTARAIGGDHVEVQALMGPGVDPHAYRQTRTDILAMRRSDLILWNGLYLEAQMEEVLEELSALVPVHAVAEIIPIEDRIAHDEYADRYDPHVWMDPGLWRAVALAITNALAERAPQHADAFAANAASYLKELAALEAYARGVLSNVADERRVLLTAHDAFNYFGRAYGYDVIGVQGISTESEAGLNRISELANLLVERQIGAVFVESSVSDRSVRALIEGAAAKGHEVRIGGELYSDAMGAPGTYEGTYVGMIDHNATVIARALGGDAPDRGMSGKLSAGS